jgi:hypothetical protein
MGGQLSLLFVPLQCTYKDVLELHTHKHISQFDLDLSEATLGLDK